MKSFLQFLSLFLAVGLLQGCTTQQQMIGQAKQIDAKFEQSFSTGDVDGVMSIYWNSPDVVLFPPGDLQARGYDQVRAAVIAAFKAMPGAKMQMSETHYTPLKDAVISWGLWKVKVPNSDLEMTGRYSEVITEKAGKWVIILDHASIPAEMK